MLSAQCGDRGGTRGREGTAGGPWGGRCGRCAPVPALQTRPGGLPPGLGPVLRGSVPLASLLTCLVKAAPLGQQALGSQCRGAAFSLWPHAGPRVGANGPPAAQAALPCSPVASHAGTVGSSLAVPSGCSGWRGPGRPGPRLATRGWARSPGCHREPPPGGLLCSDTLPSSVPGAGWQ